MSSAKSATSDWRMKRWGDVAVDVAGDQLLEALGQIIGPFARDGFAVVAEARLFLRREEERERTPAGRQLIKPDFVLRAVELVVEVVDPEFIKVAEDDVRRAVGDEADAVIKLGGSASTGPRRASSSR